MGAEAGLGDGANRGVAEESGPDPGRAGALNEEGTQEESEEAIVAGSE